MRRYMLLALAAFAAMAALATPALATNLTPPPHRALSSQWKSVNVVDWNTGASTAKLCGTETTCTLEDTGTWRTPGDATGTSKCWKGTVNFNGAVTLTHDVYAANCLGASNVNLSGQICQHLSTGEFWLRQVRDATNGVAAFGQLYGAPSGLPTQVPTTFLDGLVFGNPRTSAFEATYSLIFGIAATNAVFNIDFGGMFPENDGATNGVLIGKDNSTACNWPELS